MALPLMIHLLTSLSLPFSNFRTHTINVEEEEPIMVGLEVQSLLVFLPPVLEFILQNNVAFVMSFILYIATGMY
jgi:hypothetical protein